ncbi:hypothetical protein [Pseudotabrizicola formosa]|uniref:hypothetical protein n=1 Tax=Pseudotabrizicola formosa TaxID=2030009 RepID=UPI000CD1B091|nr:hypothetical protein [Pseudotabrizicola formosa]
MKLSAALCAFCLLASGPTFAFDLLRDTEISDDLQPTAKAFRCSVIAERGGRTLNDAVYLFGHGYRLAGGGQGLQQDMDIENRSPNASRVGLGPTQDFSIGRLYQLVLLRTELETLGLGQADLQALFREEGCLDLLSAARL